MYTGTGTRTRKPVARNGQGVRGQTRKARVLSLALREAEIVEECITSQGIRLNVRAVAAFKVGDDQASIANAARRFLSEQDRMEELVGRVFAGHLRSIIGGLTVESIIRERDRVAQEVKDGSHSEMEKLGIVVPGRGGRPRPGRLQPHRAQRHPGRQRGPGRPGRPGPVDPGHAEAVRRGSPPRRPGAGRRRRGRQTYG
ncbi:MAG TPA: flotillin family protein [Streptosporangiaceae bacterium]|nr:flotillin family protein [Streptosporangiaceae bacterium]